MAGLHLSLWNFSFSSTSSLPPSIPGVSPPELTSSLAPSALWACSHVHKDPRHLLDREVARLTSPAVLREADSP